MTEFEPKIIGFLCNFCSYAAADGAGSQRLHLPEGFRVVRVMCSGRVEPAWVLQALREGADGVVILGCHPGDCHYREGNFQARKRFQILSRLLSDLGVEKERVRLVWVSATEAARLEKVLQEVRADLKLLGPFTRKGLKAGQRKEAEHGGKTTGCPRD
ncbi:MAG: hydrogenase iron-sulfur subunit [bacterium]|nr:hydrogenase iron-sulfur subunit [bacterium]